MSKRTYSDKKVKLVSVIGIPLFLTVAPSGIPLGAPIDSFLQRDSSLYVCEQGIDSCVSALSIYDFQVGK